MCSILAGAFNRGAHDRSRYTACFARAAAGLGRLLEGGTWSTCLRLSRELGRAGSKAQLIYDNGWLGIVSPRLVEHEWIVAVLDHFVALLWRAGFRIDGAER